MRREKIYGLEFDVKTSFLAVCLLRVEACPPAREATEKELLVILHTSLTVKNYVIGTKDRLKSPFYFSKGFRVAKSHRLSSLLFPPPSPVQSPDSLVGTSFSPRSHTFERLPRPKEWMDG